uniref:Uncharacterized protein n=1 Tax=Lepeophtheirus salmonis TaxID=72036 RepID=A0A0K2TS64_LEPSM
MMYSNLSHCIKLLDAKFGTSSQFDQCISLVGSLLYPEIIKIPMKTLNSSIQIRFKDKFLYKQYESLPVIIKRIKSSEKKTQKDFVEEFFHEQRYQMTGNIFRY